MFKPCLSHLECFERDKKRYQGQKTISRTKNDIRVTYRSYACPPVINLIKAQVCDNILYQQYWDIFRWNIVKLLFYRNIFQL